VARLAGLPREILNRAKDILAHLENPNGAAKETSKLRRGKKKVWPTSDKPQMDLL
jgi:DNA mismatch repair ATPase MutS